MIQQLIDRFWPKKQEAIPDAVLHDEGALTIDEKRYFVSNILAKQESRRIIEKYIKWKVGIHTRSAMRSPDDRETLKAKERAYGLAEQTIDFQNFWNEIHRLDLTEKAKDDEAKDKRTEKRFRAFPSSEDDKE